MKILLVEDDKMLGKATKDGLKDHFAVDWSMSATDATEALRINLYHLVVLDVALPDGSGLDLLMSMRTRKDTTPVLILTARDSVKNRIEGLNAGADDYLVKPFDLDELIARCTALIRRAHGMTGQLVTWGDVSYDPTAHTVTHNKRTIPLSARELAVLDCLMNNTGKIMSKAQIENSMYGWDQDVESNTVEVHISSLRRKLGKDMIQTVRGVGYTIQPQS